MSDLVAKPVIRNKFWIVEESGQKVATIQATNDGSFVYVHDDQREHFSTVSTLKKKYQIKFGSATKNKPLSAKEVYGYPIKGYAYNELYDVVRKVPVYTTDSKSKSLYCAGYYAVNQNEQWSIIFCPKIITINRYKFFGPYKTKNEAELQLKGIINAND